MPNKMERFTGRARRVLDLAQQEAEQMHHAYIGTEHMLVALLMESSGVAGKALSELGLDLPAVRAKALELSSFPVRSAEDKSAIELSPATKRLLELAVDEARRMEHHYIGTEHLLLGIARQEDSTAVAVLKLFEVSPEDVRRRTRRILQEPPVQSNTQPVSSPPVARSMPEPEPSPPPAPAVMQIGTASYQVVKAVILKLLDMLGEGKLTTEQAIELLAAVQPGLRLTTGMQLWLSSLVNQKLENDTRKVQITVSNRDTSETLYTLTLPLTKALENLDHLLQVTVTDNRLASVTFESESSPQRVEIQLIKGDTESTP
ncbi:MAG: Clp protease N-terminal domain-containing protein [Anaerolineae bacterium]